MALRAGKHKLSKRKLQETGRRRRRRRKKCKERRMRCTKRKGGTVV
jgi:hypothetical protein